MHFCTVLCISALIYHQIFHSNGIYSGSLAVKGQYPFVVRILYYFVDRTNRTDVIQHFFKYTCSGIILNKDLVLTAATCFQQVVTYYNKSENTDFNIEKFTLYDMVFLRAGIIEGRGKNASGFQTRRGAGLIVHPDYRYESTMFDVDVALITLQTPWDFAADPTQVAPAPRSFGKRIKELDWLTCFVIGYGYTSYREYGTDLHPVADFPEAIRGNVLRYYKARVGRERYCKYLRKKLGPLGRLKGEVFDDFYVCALSRNESIRQGPCFGDIGGPLICSGIITGVMSQYRSRRSCDSKAKENTAFAVFTSVGADEVIPFLRRYVPDFPELMEVPPGNPFDD